MSAGENARAVVSVGTGVEAAAVEWAGRLPPGALPAAPDPVDVHAASNPTKAAAPTRVVRRDGMSAS